MTAEHSRTRARVGQHNRLERRVYAVYDSTTHHRIASWHCECVLRVPPRVTSGVRAACQLGVGNGALDLRANDEGASGKGPRGARAAGAVEAAEGAAAHQNSSGNWCDSETISPYRSMSVRRRPAQASGLALHAARQPRTHARARIRVCMCMVHVLARGCAACHVWGRARRAPNLSPSCTHIIKEMTLPCWSEPITSM